MFKKLAKQDRQGVRKPSDVERKYDLGEVVQTVRVVQENSVPQSVLQGYYTKDETDIKITALQEDLQTQISGIVESDDYRIVDGVTEWYNPPMEKDTEYRTTERWNGKVVYTKLVSYSRQSSMIASSSTASITIYSETADFEALVKYNGYVKLSDVIRPLPCFLVDDGGMTSTGGGYIGVQSMDESSIVLTSNCVFIPVGSVFKIQVWYTKTE